LQLLSSRIVYSETFENICNYICLHLILQLISLKAELSRKQEEVNLAKSQQQFTKPSTSDKSEKKKGNIWDKKSIGIESKKDVMSEEERESYLKSRYIIMYQLSK